MTGWRKLACIGRKAATSSSSSLSLALIDRNPCKVPLITDVFALSNHFSNHMNLILSPWKWTYPILPTLRNKRYHTRFNKWGNYHRNVINYVINATNLIHTSLSLLFGFKASTCFGRHLPIFKRHYTNAVLVSVVRCCRCGLFASWGECYQSLLIPRVGLVAQSV
jgi:hypothetical protein